MPTLSSSSSSPSSHFLPSKDFFSENTSLDVQMEFKFQASQGYISLKSYPKGDYYLLDISTLTKNIRSKTGQYLKMYDQGLAHTCATFSEIDKPHSLQSNALIIASLISTVSDDISNEEHGNKELLRDKVIAFLDQPAVHSRLISFISNLKTYFETDQNPKEKQIYFLRELNCLIVMLSKELLLNLKLSESELTLQAMSLILFRDQLNVKIQSLLEHLEMDDFKLFSSFSSPTPVHTDLTLSEQSATFLESQIDSQILRSILLDMDRSSIIQGRSCLLTDTSIVAAFAFISLQHTAKISLASEAVAEQRSFQQYILQGLAFDFARVLSFFPYMYETLKQVNDPAAPTIWRGHSVFGELNHESVGFAKVVIEGLEFSTPIYQDQKGRPFLMPLTASTDTEKQLYFWDIGLRSTAFAVSTITFIDSDNSTLLIQEKSIGMYLNDSFDDLLMSQFHLSSGQLLDQMQQLITSINLINLEGLQLPSLTLDNGQNILFFMSALLPKLVQSIAFKLSNFQLFALMLLSCGLLLKSSGESSELQFIDLPQMKKNEPMIHYMVKLLKIDHSNEEGDDDFAYELLTKWLMLHIDHEFNASTSTVRLATFFGLDKVDALSLGLLTLSGKRHGLANEQTAKMIDRLSKMSDSYRFHLVEVQEKTFFDSQKAAELFLLPFSLLTESKDQWSDQDLMRCNQFHQYDLSKEDPSELRELFKAYLKNKPLLYGFGHAIYKNKDPRSLHLEAMISNLLDSSENLMNDQMSRAKLMFALSEEVSRHPYFFSRSVNNTNVDYYSSLFLGMLNIPSKLFTPLFAIARSIGWIMHAEEQKQLPSVSQIEEQPIVFKR